MNGQVLQSNDQPVYLTIKKYPTYNIFKLPMECLTVRWKVFSQRDKQSVQDKFGKAEVELIFRTLQDFFGTF